MIKKYKLPIQGKVLNLEPLTGDPDDPIRTFPINELSDRPEGNLSYQCLEYNIDESWCEIELDADQEIHDWLEAKLADGLEIESIQETKHLELDISELDENRSQDK